MDAIDFNELFNLLQNSDETDRIEAKSAANGIGKSFLETVSAFSNEPDLGGGYILLGVTRNEIDNGSKYVITGVHDPDQLQQNIASQCRELFSILIRPTIKTISHSLGTVLLVYISEATTHEKPVFIKKHGIDAGAYRRIGSSDQLCAREDLDLLYQLRSKRKYDETLVESASFADFEPEVIKRYRYERAKIKSDAPELQYSDEDLLKAVRAIETEKGVTLPTIGGLLLFGKQMSIRRLFPLMNQVDYMLVEGREWAADSEKRYTAFEMNEALITGIPRLINQIMTDIPQVFALEEDKIRRKDNPIIPRMVIRESVVNALMHKDYRVTSTSTLSGELAPHTSPLNGELFQLSEELKHKVSALKKRTTPQEIRELVKELCASQPLRLSDIATLLGRHPKYIREKYLNDMVKLQELEHSFSDPNHPQQAYRTKRPSTN